MPGRKISILLVDDHSLVRQGFRRMLEDDPDLEVVGEAAEGHEAIERALALRPDVVVMDFALPGITGAMAAAQILKSLPEAAVLILSMHSEPNYVRTCLEAGARGYLLKNAKDLELVQAIKKVASGVQVLDPRLGKIPEPSNNGRSALSARELEVLQYIVYGKSNKEIGTILGLSVNTVAVHRANLMQALDIHNTAELVVYAIRNGLATIA